MLLLGVIGAAVIAWFSMSKLAHVQWTILKEAAPPLAEPAAQPAVTARPSIQQTPLPALEPELSPGAVEPEVERSTARAGSDEISADELRSLLGWASKLVAHADISAARLVLERAASSGDTRAIFALAETYDPNMLSAWRVHGIKGDRDRANALYAEALAKGENEARSRIFALR
jgi:hypothetical protein